MAVVSTRFTTRADGDLAIAGPADDLGRRRLAVATGSWTWLRQVHGSRVVVVDEPGGGAGEEADAAVTDRPGAVLAVHTADCVPVLLHDRAAGVVGAAHAGWRGLLSGVVGSTVEAMADLGASSITVEVGPHIRARCYEFGAGELDLVAVRFGPAVRAQTAWGTPGLDLLAAVRAALDESGAVAEVVVHPGCTACEPDRFWSHRARSDTGRQAGTVVLEP